MSATIGPMRVQTLDAKTERILPWLAAVGFFMELLDVTILNTALPTMAKDFGANPLRMQAVIIAYVLTVALLIPASGWLCERYGIRQMYLVAIAMFTSGSLFCAISPTLPILVACRVIQGIGGSLLMPVGRLSILKTFPREKLVQAMAFVTIPALIGPLLGPTLGGFLSDYASWHWAFLINIPVGIVGFLATIRYMPDLPKPEVPAPFDVRGFILFSGAIVAIVAGLEGIGELHLPSKYMGPLVAFGLTLLVIYFLLARKTRAPLFTLHLFNIRNFNIGILGNIFCRLSNGAMPFLTPLLLQLGLGFAPMKAGMTMIPMTLAAIATKSFIRKLLSMAGYRVVLCVNTLLLGLIICTFSLIGKDTPYIVLLLQFAAFGTINSTQFTSMNTLALIDLPDDLSAAGNGMFSSVMQVSMAMSVTVAALVLGEFSGLRSKEMLPQAELLGAFHNTYLVIGAFSALSFIIFLFIGPTKGKGTSKSCPIAKTPTDEKP